MLFTYIDAASIDAHTLGIITDYYNIDACFDENLLISSFHSDLLNE